MKIIDTGKIELVPVDQITHCTGAGDYVERNFADGSKRLHSGSLSERVAFRSRWKRSEIFPVDDLRQMKN